MVRAVRWLIVPCGLVIGHGLGYSVAHPLVQHEALALDTHSHLGVLGALGVPLAVCAASLMVVAGFRGGRQSIGVVQLAARLCLAFLLLEFVEHGGSTGVIAEPTLWAGLAAQVLVAAAASWALRVLAAGGRALAFARKRRRPAGGPVVELPPPAIAFRPVQRYSPISGRGPPALTAAP